MQRRRIKTQTSAQSTPKPKLVTRFKTKGNHCYDYDGPNTPSHIDKESVIKIQSLNRLRKTQGYEKTPHRKEIQPKSFGRMSKIVSQKLCVCDDCQCGRHLCKIHHIKGDLSKNTSYQKEFYRKSPIHNKVNISHEYERMKGPNLETNSMYSKDYHGNQGDDLERPHPEDLLSTGGPIQNLTSYNCQFPGVKGPNQYIKPTQKYFQGSLQFKGQTIYSKAFQGENMAQNNPEKAKDNLKTGQFWFGSTTYKQRFLQPKAESYFFDQRRKEKLNILPNFKRQFQTTYKTNFLGEQKIVCPAKAKLQTKVKGKLMKSNFLDNTNYKELSTDFHPTTTAKDSYF